MKRKNLKKPMISALEQRILFDGAAVATAVDVLDNSSFTPTNDSTTTNDMTNNNAENSVHEAQAVQGFEKTRREVAFVDVTVSDYQTLVDGVGEGVETYLVSSLDEIKSILENETNIDAIHILSHGETGEITVGNDVLNKDTLQNFDAVLQSMKTSLTENGDILLYGCNVANDGSGEEFITELATITEADVAASDDLTGSSALGGDWVLEVNTGSIEASSLEIMNYEKILSVPNDITTFESSTYYSPITVADTSGYTVTNIVSSGWDFTVYSNNNQSDAVINVEQLTGQTNLAYGGSNSGLTKIMGIELSSNTYKLFDLRSVDITMDQANGTGDNTSILMQLVGYKNGIAVSGATLTKSVTNASGGGLLVTFDVSINSNFIGIDSFKVTPTGGDYTYAIGVDNIRALNFRDPSDTTAPIFDVAPTTSNVTETTVDLSASLDEAGKIYYVVFPDGAIAPSVAQIKAGQDSTGASALKSGNSDVTISPFDGTFNITGLTANTAYDIYVVAQDDEGTPNVMASAIKVDVTTAKNLANNPTLTFTNNSADITGDDVASDGEGGSNIIGDINIEITAIDSSINKLSSLTFQNYNDLDILTFQDGINTASYGLKIESSDGSNFSLQSLDFHDWGGYSGDPFTIEAFDNDVSKGFITFNGNTTSTYIHLTLGNELTSSKFQNVDEIRIYKTDATSSWIGINNIQVGEPIVGVTITNINNFYIDTSANNTFGNTTGTISATPSSGLSITGYGINGGTGGTYTVDNESYQISKAGTYGTLYVNSTTGAYVYKPTSDSVINATSTTVTDTFTIQATDSNGTGNGTLTITINGVNDTPVLTAPTSASYTDTSATDTFTNTTGTLSASDRDTGTTLTYGISTGTTSGTDVIGGITYDVSKVGTYGTLYVKSTDGSYVYVPNANAINALTSNATDSFTVSSSDGSLNDTQTLTINITGANDAPTAQNKTITIDEDTITVLNVSDFGFADVDTGSALSSVKITSLASHGTLEYNNGSWTTVSLNQVITVTDITNGKLRFNPSLNENGTSYATFNFTVNDGTVDSTAKTITYNVTAVNDAPTVANAIADQNASVSNIFNFTIPTNSFTDVDTSDTLTYTAKLVDSNGDLVSSGTLPSWLSFDANTKTFSGTPTNSDTGIIYIKVTVSDNGSLNVSDIFTITTNSGPTVSVATGSYTDTIANDTFANITGSISATASSGSILGYGINSGTTGGSTTIGSVTYDVSKAGTYGTLYVKSSDGSYIYVPTSDSVINATTSTVTDSFTIEATDGAGTKGNTLTISINGVNDSPVLSAPTEGSYTDTSATDTFTNTTGTLSASDRDTGTTLTYGISTGTTSGTDVIGGITYDVSKVGTYGTLYVKSTDGSYVYVPNANAINALTSNATDSFTVSSSDGSLNDTQTLTINITGANDAPTAQNKTITIDEDTITVLNVSDFGFADVDTGSALSSVKITSLASHGTLEYNNGSWTTVSLNQVITVTDITNGKLRFNPSLNENGTSYATFNFTVNDGTVDSTAKTITYNVTAVNDAPTVANAIADQNASVSNIFNFTIPTNSFTDVDTSDTLTYTAKLVDSNGDLVSSGTLPSWLSFDTNTKTFSGTPTNSDTGIIYIKVTASDNGSLNVSDIFTITTNSGPTVSVATGSYTDTVANDTFANITGSISATASSGSILGYGINSGTTGGSTTIGSVTYDVSKAGTYGTLYVKSSDGSYIYVPTSDSVINATSSTVTDVFTIEATDAAGTKGNTLTISINGVNDTPSISNEIINQTATQNSIFNFTIPTNSFIDVDTSDTLTYTAKLVDSSGNLINGGILPTWLIFNTGTKTFSGTPTNNDVGTIYLRVTATDNGLGNLNVSDVFSIKVENINDNPIGNVIISGSPIQGEILTASNTLTDEDGLGEITYQWYANNEIIDGATNSTYTLTQNEVNKVITVKATYIDGFGTLESVISNVTNQILNINDAPTVLTDNLDVNLAFGDSYTKDITELFKDIDFDNIFTFEATDLPLGLTLNPSTGIISGKANESGEFIVTIKATDNGNPALSVSRTYKIFVLAPVQIENSQPPVSEPLNNTPSNVFSDITLSTFLDTISLGTINNNLGTNITDNIGIGYLNNTPPTLQINDTFNPSQNIPIIKDNGKYIETTATLNVNLNGQVSFDKTIQGSFSIVGITIEDLKIDNNKLDIKIVDTANVQNYIVTQFDGSALPAGLYFNSSTGSISGTIPDNLNELNITIKAINLDGTTRVLNLKLDLKELKQKMQAEVNEKFIGLKEQIAFENQKLDGYGSYLTKLFA